LRKSSVFATGIFEHRLGGTSVSLGCSAADNWMKPASSSRANSIHSSIGDLDRDRGRRAASAPAALR